MIDQDKMRALAEGLRAAGPLACREAADAIDLLLAELEAANMQLTVPDWAEGDDQAWDKVMPAVAWHLIERHGENWAHIGRMMQAYLDAHTATLRVELEAAAADTARLDFLIDQQAWVQWTVRDGSILQCQVYDQDEDENYHILSGEDRYFNTPRAAIDAALAQRQGEGS
ncbi:hypothetical protein [Burkholderia vietnamiensis]|uniref:hypothetical protein n=1 Tax=Burkholderia vietnamiensis TaxID=60552 RepID=UPI002011643E|nr:hypothetical protein [Burkholderia vietnamiensis]